MSTLSWLGRARLGTTLTATRRQRRALRERLSAKRSLLLEPLEDRRLLAFAAATSYPVGSDPREVVTADFNNDSVPDLAVLNNGSSSVSVLLGNGDGTFQAAIDSSTIGSDGAGQWPHAIAVGDLDGDGYVDDVATVNSADVSVLLGDGSGGLVFEEALSLPDQTVDGFTLTQYPVSVAVGDVTGDGKIDLTATGHTSYSIKHGPYTGYDYWGFPYSFYTYEYHNNGHVNVLTGEGAGDFSAPAAEDVQLLPGAYPISALLEELDTNVGLDLAIADYYGARVQVLSGNDDGTFDAPVDFSTGWNPTEVQSADFNGDGIHDLMTPNYYSANVLLGNGTGANDGTFQSPKTTYLPAYPVSVAVGDINDDGVLDLVSSSSYYYYGYYGRVDVLLGYGDGTFIGAGTHWFDAGTYAAGVAVGDFDGDGVDDLAVANSYGSEGLVSVLINEAGWILPAKLSIGDASVTEGNSGTTNMVFTVTRSGNLAGSISASYSTVNGGALAGSDYIAATGTVTFGSGEATATIEIQVKGDLIDEFNQSFYVNLSSSTDIVIDGQGAGTILDDDAPPTVSITPKVSGKEGNNNTTKVFAFIVTLSAASEKEVRVTYSTANGTATTADGDYITAAGTLVFAPGTTSKQISVTVKGDKKKEGTETFVVNLTGATNATIVGAQGIGEITDDDIPPGKAR